MNTCDKFLAGWAMADITPDKQVALLGQFEDRFSEYVRDPITVTALAVESLDELGNSITQSVMVSCDLIMIPDSIQNTIKDRIAKDLKDFDSNNIFMNATHIHTGPYIIRNPYIDRVFCWPGYRDDIMTPEEYGEFLVNKVCEAIVSAWNKRSKGGVSWQLGHAVIGHNRRLVYDDETALMYGTSDTINFRGLEGPVDNGVELLYFWNDKKELTGVVVNVACPSQVLEHKPYITADFWGELRKLVWSKYGKNVYVYAMCGAAGDQSPRDLVRRGRGEADMYSEEGITDIAERLLNTIEYKLKNAKDNIVTKLIHKHSVKVLQLPYRTVTKADYEKEKTRLDALTKKYSLDTKPVDKDNIDFQDLIALYEAEGTMTRYEESKKSPAYEVEAHFLRIGDIAIATNPFELFTEYGLMIKARSAAVQTFIAQLSCDEGGYLATEKAIKGGHYSTTIASGKVGPYGGQLLADYSVKYINEMWK